jgi:hypothetical protein
MKTEDWLILGGIGVAIYLLSKASNAVGNAADSAASSIANAYVNLTSPAAPVPQGSVIMPNGSTIPASSLTNMDLGYDDSGALTFLGSDGNTYQLSSQTGGNYQASLY